MRPARTPTADRTAYGHAHPSPPDTQVDMIEAYGELQFNLDFYTDGGDMSRLADVINDVRPRRPCATAPGSDAGSLEQIMNRRRSLPISTSPTAQNKRMARYAKLTRGLCELVDDYGLVSFATLNVQAR